MTLKFTEDPKELLFLKAVAIDIKFSIKNFLNKKFSKYVNSFQVTIRNSFHVNIASYFS